MAELSHLVRFLFQGEIYCENEAEALLVLENLEKIFGYPEKLNMNHPNTVFEVKLIEKRFSSKFKPIMIMYYSSPLKRNHKLLFKAPLTFFSSN